MSILTNVRNLIGGQKMKKEERNLNIEIDAEAMRKQAEIDGSQKMVDIIMATIYDYQQAYAIFKRSNLRQEKEHVYHKILSLRHVLHIIQKDNPELGDLVGQAEAIRQAQK